jgi:hypothetical protein
MAFDASGAATVIPKLKSSACSGFDKQMFDLWEGLFLRMTSGIREGVAISRKFS